MVVGDESQSVFVCSWCTHAYCAGPGCVDVFVPRTCISNAKLKTDCVSTAKKNAVISASNVRTKVSRKDLNCIHRWLHFAAGVAAWIRLPRGKRLLLYPFWHEWQESRVSQSGARFHGVRVLQRWDSFWQVVTFVVAVDVGVLVKDGWSFAGVIHEGRHVAGIHWIWHNNCTIVRRVPTLVNWFWLSRATQSLNGRLCQSSAVQHFGKVAAMLWFETEWLGFGWGGSKGVMGCLNSILILICVWNATHNVIYSVIETQRLIMCLKHNTQCIPL